jgi:glutaredoxin
MYQREVVLYTRRHSLPCWRAKRLLKRRGYRFEVVDITKAPKLVATLSEAVHHGVTLPYVFVDHRPVGDFGVIKALCRSGEFEHLIRDDL